LAAEGAKLAGLYAGNPKRDTDRPTAERLLEAFQDITLTIIKGPHRTERYVQTPPRHPFHQWELKPTGYGPGKSPLGTPHFSPYNPPIYYIL
jgi:hypothetical protein